VELPRLQPLWERLREEGLAVVAVEATRDRRRALEFVEQKGLTYPVLENGEGPEEVVHRLFGVRVFPTSFLVDRHTRLEGEIRKLLQEGSA
jgi:hypothetical protein